MNLGAHMLELAIIAGVIVLVVKFVRSLTK